MANQGSAKQDRPETDQPVSMRRTGPGRSDLSRWETEGHGPFAWMRQMQDQIDRAFTGLRGGKGSPAWGANTMLSRSDWSPALDVFQRGNDLVIRADVPGLSKDDITVDVGDDAVTIRGERRYDHEEERDGVFRSERSYGSFYRAIPLPEGAIADSAKATFNNGVLEIVLQAPSADVRRGRRLEIKERTPEKADPSKA
jgi:HSP20 family protein